MSDHPALLSVAQALARVLEGASLLGSESVALAAALGRTLSADLISLRTQPPVDVSAMDGYALRHEDIGALPASLRLIGESAAGHGFAGQVHSGEAVRIFTGAPLPAGADTVIIQENTEKSGTHVLIKAGEPKGRHIRTAGLDFTQGEVLLRKGERLKGAELALAAAMNHASLPVARMPRVAILASGNELVQPGQPVGEGQIVASNTQAIAAFVADSGGIALDLGIARDTPEALEAGLRAAKDAQVDILVTLGGASVGDHDLVRETFAKAGMDLNFWKIAMRPGKPMIHGRFGAMHLVGLPGNPVSSIVCGILFLVPLIRALCGDPHAGDDPTMMARLGCDLRANDFRADYMRATLENGADGVPVVMPQGIQDSSMLRILARSQALLLREPFAPEAKKGDLCRIVRLS